ncbi:hypothetical protein MKW94_014553 [Papaver nudicaule]|uniref:Bms1-type G domain-containing protein n=1 Tax=Papaver nudicaule TaxID=74823 RepID=A0AA41SRQ1_PAPNU|nr:hypothetical protein [Papaver nudicaule]
MASPSSSSSDDQEYVLCGRGYLHVFKANGSPEVSAAAAVDHTVEEEEPPPYVIVVHGPSKAGKSLLIKSLAENYPEDVKLYKQGLVTIISGEQRRIQFVECPNHVKSMHDAARYADAVILLIDAQVGLERADTVSLLIDVLRVHGMAKVMGVLTSLDMFKNAEEQTKTKEHIMNFWTGTYEGARLFCLSGLEHGMYLKHEIHELGSFISQMDFHPLSWRAAKFYVVVDHFEDVTRPERVHMDNRCNRDVVFYGYLRGCDIKKGAKVHINGVGDFPLFSVTSLIDPCPLLASPKRKISRKGKEHDESEGFGPGTYLRLEVRDVPFEYDPYHPILVGGISPGEENVGYMQRDTAAIDRTVEQPPYVIVVQGTHKVGKSLLIKSLVEHYTKVNLNVYMKGPVTIISGEQRRVQFVECPNNINGMLDAAKYADAVILVIDAYIGFEMETFEFVNILRVHGMPKVLGELTSLDLCKNVEKLSRTKEYLKNYFRTEIYEGAGIFCLSGLDHEMYPEHEILALASFISVMEFHPLSKRAAEPYLLVDRFEDVTHPERVLMDNRCSRDIVHIAGVGDFPLFGVTSLNDPCPLLASLKRKRYLKGNVLAPFSQSSQAVYLCHTILNDYLRVETLLSCNTHISLFMKLIEVRSLDDVWCPLGAERIQETSSAGDFKGRKYVRKKTSEKGDFGGKPRKG